MTTYATRVAHVAIILLLTIGIMIVYAMPDKDVPIELNETYTILPLVPTPEPITTPAPIPTSVPPQPTPTPEKIDISALSWYDRDNDGELNTHEIGVIEYDYLNKLLTPAQIECYENLGCVPSITPAVAPPESAPTSVVNATIVPTDYTVDSRADMKQWRAAVADIMPEIVVGDVVERVVQWGSKFLPRLGDE